MSIETSDCVNLISTQLVGIRRFLCREEMFGRNLAQCLKICSHLTFIFVLASTLEQNVIIIITSNYRQIWFLIMK